MSRDDPELTSQIVAGISDACIEADCALLGGETAILPDFYKEGEYDLAGFCVGVVERKHVLNGSEIRHGDKVIGLASSGLHSNGYSLARKIVFEHAGLSADTFVPELGRTVADELLEPTRLYVRAVKTVYRPLPREADRARDCAHHRGGTGGEPAADPCRTATGSCCGVGRGRCRRSFRGSSRWGRSTSRRWIGFSTWGSAW